MLVPQQWAAVLCHAHLTTTPTISIPEVQDQEYQSYLREEAGLDSVPLAETWNRSHPPRKLAASGFRDPRRSF